MRRFERRLEDKSLRSVMMVLEIEVIVFPGPGLELRVETDDIILDPAVRICGRGCPSSDGRQNINQ